MLTVLTDGNNKKVTSPLHSKELVTSCSLQIVRYEKFVMPDMKLYFATFLPPTT